MRIYSYIFHGLLALFLLGISSLALLSDTNLHLDVMPWSGRTLTYVVFFGAIFGMVVVVLALKGLARLLFFVWSMVVLGFILRGFFLSPYTFPGRSEFNQAIYFTIAAILALVGAWYAYRAEPERR